MQETIIGTIYIYEREREDSPCSLNPNNVNRIDQYGNFVTLDKEVLKGLPDKGLIATYLGFLNDPYKVAIYFANDPSQEDKNISSEIVYKHKNNIPDKYGVWYQDAFVQDPANPGQAYLFDTEEQAQQFIVTDGLTGATVKGVVVL